MNQFDNMIWSYSRVKAFDFCPFGWKLKYLDFPYPMGKDFFSFYGSFMHRLLKKYFSGELSESEARRKYLAGFYKKIVQGAPSQKVRQNYFAGGLRYGG